MLNTKTNTTVETALRASVPGLLLRLEAVAVVVAAVGVYFDQGWSWIAFVALLLVPDVSMIGYLVNSRVGALAYDVVHTYALPLALLAFGLLTGASMAMQLAMIWFAHIGLDRVLGYGLKYAAGFKDTHLQRV